METNAIAPKSV